MGATPAPPSRPAGTHGTALPPLQPYVVIPVYHLGPEKARGSSHTRAVLAPDPALKQVCRACQICAPAPTSLPGQAQGQVLGEGHLQGEAEPQASKGRAAQGEGVEGWATPSEHTSPPDAGLRALGPLCLLCLQPTPRRWLSETPFHSRGNRGWGRGGAQHTAEKWRRGFEPRSERVRRCTRLHPRDESEAAPLPSSTRGQAQGGRWIQGGAVLPPDSSARMSGPGPPGGGGANATQPWGTGRRMWTGREETRMPRPAAQT